MIILSKIDRFRQIPKLSFRGYPFASSFIGVALTIIIMILLAAVFSILVSTAVDSPTTASFVSPMSFVDQLDLIPGDFRFCVVRLESSDPTYATEADLQNLFDNELQSQIAAYTLSEDQTRVDRAYKYCPDRSTSPIAHCICLDEVSLMISPSDTLYVKINLSHMPNDRTFDFFLVTKVIALIPNKLTDAFITNQKKDILPSLYRNYGILSVTLDKLVYTIDDNYFINTPKTTYSLVPKAATFLFDINDAAASIQGWALTFSGQAVTSETTATKILSILAQVGALNGVLVIVFTVLFLPFFKLKYTENLLNGLNSRPKPTTDCPGDDKPYTKNPSLLIEGVELQETSPKKRVQALVRQKIISKKPLHIGFWQWLRCCFKGTHDGKTLQENEIAVKEHSEVASVVRTKMDLELIKSILFSPEQKHMLESIPFESFALGQDNQKAQVMTERSFLDPFELLRSQTYNEDVQARFIELVKKYYD